MLVHPLLELQKNLLKKLSEERLVESGCEFYNVGSITVYTGCHRRNGPNFGRVFLMLNYTDITQNTYIQS